MYAVIRSGGKQYRVSKGDFIRVERLPVDEGQDIDMTDVVLLNDGDNTTVGKPVVEGAVVKANVVANARNKKIIVFKKKRRQNYRRTKGHRQHYTKLEIKDIVIG